MDRGSCIFYRSFYESIKELTPEQQVQIYDAIFKYEFDNEEVELTGVCKSIFTLIIPQLEANNKRYTNGCKGGRPKNNQKETKTKPNENQKETKVKANYNENENENYNVNDNKYYVDKKLNDIFMEYLQVRKKLKAVNSDRAIKTLLNKLEKYSDDVKYKMIEQSIVRSWKDVYEIKDKTPGWLDKEIISDEMTPEEEAEFRKRLNEINGT